MLPTFYHTKKQFQSLLSIWYVILFIWHEIAKFQRFSTFYFSLFLVFCSFFHFISGCFFYVFHVYFLHEKRTFFHVNILLKIQIIFYFSPKTYSKKSHAIIPMWHQSKDWARSILTCDFFYSLANYKHQQPPTDCFIPKMLLDNEMWQ